MRYRKMLKFSLVLLPLLACIRGGIAPAAFAQDRLPVREYTNPDEMVTFDRNTSFERALDVINEFSQEHRGKIILDRTATQSALGISIPPMHWEDALDMMLRVKELQLVEHPDFFEIVIPLLEEGQRQVQASAGGQQQVELLATTETREVRINAIFFEGSRRALREIGVDWSTLTENVPGNLPDFVTGEGGGQIPSTSGFNDQFVSVNAKGASSVSQNVFNALVNFGQIGTSGIEVQALFSAFEAENLGQVLASPSVKVIDSQEGYIQVGSDFSIKQRDFAGNVTDQFVSVGTILTVTPTIIEQNDTTFIHLNIAAERSSAQPDPISTVITKQEATTQAILMDGEATAIAGLYRTETAEVRRGVPILKDLPPWFFGLRYLFGFNSKDYQMRELVILVQAEIEPSIPQRYNRLQDNKFEVLDNARRRVRSEIKAYEQYDPSVPPDTEEEEQQEISQKELFSQPSEMEEELELAQAENDLENEKNEQEKKPQTSDQQPDMEKEIVYPELDVEPVPLNLGVEDSDSVLSAEKEEVAVHSADTTGNKEPTTREPVDTPEKRVTSAGSEYYLIAASFIQEKNAVGFKDQLVDEGFDAIILTNPDSEFHFVAYRGYKDEQEARTGLADIRQYYNSEAWLYTKN